MLTVANAVVYVDEGASVVNGGTASDVDFDTIILAASTGTVQRTPSGWHWIFTANDGPTQSQVVTISADDGRGGTTSATFDLIVNNVAPAVYTGTSTSIVSNTLLSFSGSFADAIALDGHGSGASPGG